MNIVSTKPTSFELNAVYIATIEERINKIQLFHFKTNFQVSWIRRPDVVILTHGNLVFTSDERFKVKSKIQIIKDFCFCFLFNDYNITIRLILVTYFNVLNKASQHSFSQLICSLEFKKIN